MIDGEGRTQPDYPLAFHFDQVYREEGRYAKAKIQTLLNAIFLGYGVNILRPILQRAVRNVVKKRDEGRIQPLGLRSEDKNAQWPLLTQTK